MVGYIPGQESNVLCSSSCACPECIILLLSGFPSHHFPGLNKYHTQWGRLKNDWESRSLPCVTFCVLMPWPPDQYWLHHWQLLCWPSEVGVLTRPGGHLAPAAALVLQQQQPPQLPLLHWTSPQQHLLCRHYPGLEERGHSLWKTAPLWVSVQLLFLPAAGCFAFISVFHPAQGWCIRTVALEQTKWPIFRCILPWMLASVQVIPQIILCLMLM